MKNIDVIFCIDATGSMSPILDTMQEEIKNYCENLAARAEEGGSMRIKLIAFRDYGIDLNPMEVSRWFTKGEDDKEMKDAFKNVVAQGGGDLPECGLEALWLAFHSDFREDAAKIVYLITDADAKELHAEEDSENYPKDVGNKEDLVNAWNGLPGEKAIIAFIPEDSVYGELGLDRYSKYFLSPYCGGSEIELEHLVKSFLIAFK